MDQFSSNISLLFEFPVVNLKIVIDGVMIGSLFALAAYGLALVWGVMNVKNLAQGDLVISGGYVSWWLTPPWDQIRMQFMSDGDFDDDARADRRAANAIGSDRPKPPRAPICRKPRRVTPSQLRNV